MVLKCKGTCEQCKAEQKLLKTLPKETAKHLTGIFGFKASSQNNTKTELANTLYLIVDITARKF